MLMVCSLSLQLCSPPSYFALAKHTLDLKHWTLDNTKPLEKGRSVCFFVVETLHLLSVCWFFHTTRSQQVLVLCWFWCM